MTITDQQIRALTFLATACRPTGAKRWDTDGTFANIAKVRERQLAEVVLATIRAASDRDVDSPGVIPSNGSHWAESASVAVYAPRIIAPENRCGICSKDREHCPRERVADDDHVFDDGRRVPVDVARTVAALKDELAPTAPPPVIRTLDDRLAAIPPEDRDPGIEHVRQQLAKETTA